VNNPDLSVNIGGIELKNPVLTASGTFGYGEEYSDYVDLNRLGGIVVKGLSLEPYEGNPPPRIIETPAGMLNSIGLQNIGLNAFINEKMPFLRRYDTKVIVNFFGMTMNQYSEFASKVSDVDGVAGLEMNISCPNLDKGGMIFGVDPGLTHKVVSAVRKATTLPLIVKLSPNVTDITVIARAAADAGADALSLINTLLGMAIDIDSGRPKLANITGGLSGPAIRPVALRMVWEAAKTVDLPVIGIGGIMTANHAIEFIIAGAHAVQVGTASFVDPESSIKIVDGIEAYCRDKGLTGVGELVGSLRV